MVKKYCPIQLDTETYHKIDKIAKALNQPKTRFLSELIDEIYHISSQFPNMSIIYNSHLTLARLYIHFLGKSNIVVKEITLEEEKQLLKGELKHHE